MKKKAIIIALATTALAACASVKQDIRPVKNGYVNCTNGMVRVYTQQHYTYPETEHGVKVVERFCKGEVKNFKLRLKH